jgi:hypothetical protein
MKVRNRTAILLVIAWVEAEIPSDNMSEQWVGWIHLVGSIN